MGLEHRKVGGNGMQGEALYAHRCAACHGDFGEGVAQWPVLVGGSGTLASHDPVKTTGSYWPLCIISFMIMFIDQCHLEKLHTLHMTTRMANSCIYLFNIR